jgi:hypothetical protein
VSTKKFALQLKFKQPFKAMRRKATREMISGFVGLWCATRASGMACNARINVSRICMIWRGFRGEHNSQTFGA